MLHATELLGAATYDVLGNYVGRVRELFIEPADQPNRVARFLLARGKFQPLVARYDQVAFAVPGSIKLNVGEKSLEEYHANEGWLAVQKDLLDQQIIDTGGRKVVRVNDLDLAEHHINDCVELRVSQADVGVTGAVGGLLPGIASPALIRRIQDRLPARMIRWEFVNLIEPDPLRRIKLRVSHQKLAHLHPADLADILEALSPEERQSIIDSLDETSAAETLAALDSRLRQQIVEKLDPEKAADIIEEMDPDQAADLLSGLSPETSKELLEEMPQREASDVRALMNFEQNTAGGMMNTNFMLVGETATREEVIDFIRSNESDLEQLDAVFLTDLEAKFTGIVPTGRLLLASTGQTMNSLKSEPLLSLPSDATEKEVLKLFDKYNLRVLGVVDENGVPIGAITVDDVVTRLAAKVYRSKTKG